MKIYVTLSQAKFLLTAFELLAKKSCQISRKEIIKNGDLDKREVSRIIQNRYLLENQINEVNQISQKGAK
jgi:hypothetical protein